jgi:hypothetical protein
MIVLHPARGYGVHPWNMLNPAAFVVGHAMVIDGGQTVQ